MMMLVSSGAPTPTSSPASPASPGSPGSPGSPATVAATGEQDPTFVAMVRWTFTARLVCLAVVAVAAPPQTWPAQLSLYTLTVASLVFSRRTDVVRLMLRHPLLASLDVALTVMLLVSVQAGQPAALPAVCSALLSGMIFPLRLMPILVVPLVVGGLGAPETYLGDDPARAGWLTVVAGMPLLFTGVAAIGAVVRHSFELMLSSRLETATAVSALVAAEERARVARDIHDSVGKSLHGIGLTATALTRVAASDTDSIRRLADGLAGAADRAAAEARQLLVSLREGQDDRPTIVVIHEVLDRWQRAGHVAVDLGAVEAVDAAPMVTRQMALALGELLHNIDRHADASAVAVSLTGDSQTVTLTVHDDGRGFDVSGLVRPGRYGLAGVAERAEQCGGSAQVLSAAGEGTVVRWTAQRDPWPKR